MIFQSCHKNKLRNCYFIYLCILKGLPFFFMFFKVLVLDKQATENWSHKVSNWEDQEENEEEEEEWFVDPQKDEITDVEESDSDDDYVS